MYTQAKRCQLPVDRGKEDPRSHLKRIVVAYPGGNTTAIVNDDLTGLDLTTLNARIITSWAKKFPRLPGIEQCCYLTKPRTRDALVRVEMFGGETCINATRAVALLKTEGRSGQGLIEVSGAESPFAYSVKAGAISSVAILLSSSQERVRQICKNDWLVNLDGITHLVRFSGESFETPRKTLEELLKTNSYGISDMAAFGVTVFDEITNNAKFCVWVKKVNTIFDETACGSGTAAIAIATKEKTKRKARVDAIQPSGEVLIAEASESPQGITASSVSGVVTILYEWTLGLLP